ncbi:MAG: MYXO-CTERM sorting domain-containing protein [Myxococcota bacterium]|nr:MYXO-CTERM sorting domain-containing protein [Myxococcota bacterium]
MLRRSLASIPLMFVTLAVAPAAAEPGGPSWQLDTPVTEQPKFGSRREVIVRPPLPGTVAPALISQTIYLNRCTGGCAVNAGADDDASSTIPTSGIVATNTTFSEFKNAAGVAGAAADAEWNALMQCMREIYSPYDVQITDVRPAQGSQYHMAIVAGTPQEAGRDANTLGVAIVRSDCTPRNNAVSLNFANAHGPNDRTNALCHTVGQESAHAFGLDHSYAFSDGRSSCNDPMTYRSDCGGQRFYRNDSATCGEFEPRQCSCGNTSQNSHAKILTTFGANPGTPLIGPPTAVVTTPAAGGTLGAIVAAQAGSKRGIAKLELLLNGFEWAEVKGAAFGQNGQPNPGAYSLPVPTAVPGGVIDVVVRAYDDLGVYTDSAAVTVSKGPPCTSAESCATGQKCEAGKCFWDPPSGEVGDDCTYPQFCKSLNCQGTEEQKICTKNCVPGTSDSCPEGLACTMTGPGTGICFLEPEAGGCCSVGGKDGAPWVHGGVAALLLGLLLRRRKR